MNLIAMKNFQSNFQCRKLANVFLLFHYTINKIFAFILLVSKKVQQRGIGSRQQFYRQRWSYTCAENDWFYFKIGQSQEVIRKRLSKITLMFEAFNILDKNLTCSPSLHLFCLRVVTFTFRSPYLDVSTSHRQFVEILFCRY